MGGDVREQNKLILDNNISLENYNGIVIGQSAGAYNLCENIYLTKIHKESDSTLHLKGMGLVDEIIDVHFEKENKQNIQDLIELNKEIICLTDRGAIVFDDGPKQIKGDVFILKNGVLEKGKPQHIKSFLNDKKDTIINDKENNSELIQELYRNYDENIRLNRSRAARIEFLTNTRYIEKYLIKGSKILDVGAGAGEYSLHFARKGYDVSALELADSNIKAFRSKLTSEDNIDLVQGNALDLSRYKDNLFDIVLLFGPLYHLNNEAEKLKCIDEAKRVCKKGGKIFFAFISNDMVLLTMFNKEPDYFVNGNYDKKTFKGDNFPFVLHTVDACRALLSKSNLMIIHEVSSDGLTELLKDRINTMDDENYDQYIRYHFYICEKPEFLGASNHLLFVAEK